MCNNPLFHSAEWTVEDIDNAWEVIDNLAKSKYGLDYYPPAIEIVTADQMILASAQTGMPIMYEHWSFGKSFIEMQRQYQQGVSGLAYEMVINTNPSVCYIMEDNSSTMQALVLAHAACGHSSFFKNNYLFKQWTDPDGMINYLKYAKKFIAECYAEDEKSTEVILDFCHRMKYNGVFKYKRYHKNKDMIERETENLRKITEESVNDLLDTAVGKAKKGEELSSVLDFTDFGVLEEDYLKEPEENILYAIEKSSKLITDKEREIIRIVRTIGQYFYPQIQTKVMNEGWASFWHYTLMTDLHEEGYISEGNYLEFLHSHTGVVNQLSYKQTRSVNPYVLGFKMFMDIKRICEAPDAEDLELFSEICNTDWLTTLKDIAANYRDESFIRQFLSPKVAKDLKLFVLEDDEFQDTYVIKATQSDRDFKTLRAELANHYVWERMFFSIEVAALSDDGIADIVVILEEGQAMDSDTYLFLEEDLLGYFTEVKLNVTSRKDLNELFGGSLKKFIKQTIKDNTRG